MWWYFNDFNVRNYAYIYSFLDAVENPFDFFSLWMLDLYIFIQIIFVSDTVKKKYKNWNDNLRDENQQHVILYPSSSCFKPVWGSFFCCTQKKIFWRMLMDPIDSREKRYYVKKGSMGSIILQNIFFWVQQKKEIHDINYDRIFIFKWTIPLKLSFAALYTHWTLMCTERHSALCGQENKIDNNIMNSWKGSQDGATRNKAKIKSQK